MATDKARGRSRDAITIDRRDQIVALINDWKPTWGKLSGPALESKVREDLKLTLTRQGMFKHAEIDQAFRSKRQTLSGGKKARPRSIEDNVLLQRISSLEQERSNLKDTIRRYDELFIRYIFNANEHGFSVDQLSKALPSTLEGA
ncbi:hypothetical protein [Novosphingobium resinovorum]|uniref:hypothetical protein n=1 Tax=Novosphingobium resinovorum TaxID=158500 RepID=UPI002ED00EC6